MAADWLNRDELYWATTAAGGFNGGTEDEGGDLTWSSNGQEHAFTLLEQEVRVPMIGGAGLALLIVLLAAAGVVAVRRIAA